MSSDVRVESCLSIHATSACTPRLVMLLRRRFSSVIIFLSLRKVHSSCKLLSEMFWFSTQIFSGFDCRQHLIAACMYLETSAVYANETSSYCIFNFESFKVVALLILEGLVVRCCVLKKTGFRFSWICLLSRHSFFNFLPNDLSNHSVSKSIW